MTKRRQSRELAFKLLYALELSDESADYIKENFISVLNHYSNDVKTYALKLFDNYQLNKEKIDRSISKFLKNWSIDRISRIDKNLIRLGFSEINLKELEINIIVNEVLEISKIYGDKDSTKFINAVLDNYYKSLKFNKD
jgi:transcription antitermination protein NusB